MAGRLCCGCLVFVYEDDELHDRMEAILESEGHSDDALEWHCPVHPSIQIDRLDPQTRFMAERVYGMTFPHKHSFVSFLRFGEGAYDLWPG